MKNQIAILLFGGEITNIGNQELVYISAIKITWEIEKRRLEKLMSILINARLDRAIYYSKNKRLVYLKSKNNTRKPIILDSVNFSIASENNRFKMNFSSLSKDEITEDDPNKIILKIKEKIIKLSETPKTSLIEQYKMQIYHTNNISNALKSSTKMPVVMTPRNHIGITDHIHYTIDKICYAPSDHNERYAEEGDSYIELRDTRNEAVEFFKKRAVEIDKQNPYKRFSKH